MVRCVTAACIVAIISPGCTIYITEVQAQESGEDDASSFPASSYPGADSSSSSSSTGDDTRSTTGEPEEGSTSAADSSTGEDEPSTSGATIEGSTSDAGTTTTSGSSSTGEPWEEGTSTSGAPQDETTGSESESSTGGSTSGEPEPPPPPLPVQCMQLDPGACGVGLCFSSALQCVGDESFLAGGSLQPGEAQTVPANQDQQRVVHVLDLPAGQVNAVVTSLTGGTQVDYRLYTATGELTAAGSSAGVTKIGINAAQPAVYLLVVGEVLAKPMAHEVKLVTVPTKKHNDTCDTDAQCLTNFCRASAFDAAPRCLTPCTRASVLDCANKGLPGLCVETGADKTLLCAGTHVLEVADLYDNKICKVDAMGWCIGDGISDADDVDVWLIDGSAALAYYPRFITNGVVSSKLKGTWLDASGALIAEAVVPNKTSASGPLRPAKSWTWLIVSSADGTTNGFQPSPFTP